VQQPPPHPESQDRKRPDRKRSVTRPGWRILCLILLASAWGLGELIGGETVWLTAWGLLLLATARTLVNRLGSSTALAVIALLFRSVHTTPHACHLAGIALLGIAFDLTATLLWREDRKPFLRAAITGASSAYASCFLFATSMVWIVEYKHWAGGGLERIGEHTLSSGSLGALVGLGAVPLGLWLGGRLLRHAEGSPRAALAATATLCMALWALAPFVA
jgi:hypothetical protein